MDVDIFCMLFYEGELKNRISGSKFEILYDDNEEETLDLQSLQLTEPAAGGSIRCEWYMTDHVPDAHVRNRLTQLFDGLKTCVNVHTNTTKNEESPVKSVANNATSRNRRVRKPTVQFRPEQNLNDKAIKKKRKRCNS